MKKTILLLTAILLVTQLTAQFHRVQYLRDTYRGEEGVVSLYIPGFLCRFAANIGDLEDEEEALLRSIRSLQVLVIENEAINRRVNFVDEIAKPKFHKDYEILLSVHEAGEDVLILAKEKRGRVKELLVVVGGEENVLVCIKGRMNRDLFESLYDLTGIEGTRYMQEI